MSRLQLPSLPSSFHISSRLLLLGLTFFFCSSLSAKKFDGASARWAEIQEMEKGPQSNPKNRPEAAQLTREHLLTHQQMLESFIADFPQDQRQFQARLRQAALIASRATLENDRLGLERAYRLLVDLERARNITREQAADAAFQRVSILFLQARGQEERMREMLVNASTNFHSRYPSDGRGPRLLVEAAGICDPVPRTKRALLETAVRDTRDEAVKARALDDLRRLDLLGQTVPLEFETTTGAKFSLEEERGKVVLLIFWAADSPHSLFWLGEFLQQIQELPPGRPVVASINLDTEEASMREVVEELQIRHPIGFDGKGWEGTLVRNLGINALPMVWIFDKKGRLRSINARDDYLVLIRRLEAER